MEAEVCGELCKLVILGGSGGLGSEKGNYEAIRWSWYGFVEIGFGVEKRDVVLYVCGIGLVWSGRALECWQLELLKCGMLGMSPSRPLAGC